ncbi:hypothetical protein F0562_013412 [Nyssa sinensis]|uniref:Dirigent protein n=1 Tax=Nyssa sinensis TaxID=561372 RepID=A0A5J4ZN96_9ASTE|nr:hypothetical protein F0562_013412 [Nyssa sinensis]
MINNTNGAFSEQLSEAIAMKRMEKTSHLHFYFHDILGGKNPSAVQIAGAANSTFGVTMMVDDALTEGSELSSKLVGRAQGMYAVASQSQRDISLLMVMNFAFMEGLLEDMHWQHTIWFDSKTGDATVEYNVFVQHY